jgi:hypothetical protein
MGDLMSSYSNFLTGVQGHMANVIILCMNAHDNKTDNLVKMLLEQNDHQMATPPNAGVNKLHQEPN